MTVQAARRVGERRQLTRRGGDAMNGRGGQHPKIAFPMTGVRPAGSLVDHLLWLEHRTALAP
jgi:hypothetical protein